MPGERCLVNGFQNITIKTKDMKKSHLITLIIIVAIIVGIAIGIYLSDQKDNTSSEREERQSKLTLINARIKAIQEKIDSEMKALQLSTEMEHALNKMLDRLCMLMGIISSGVVVAVCYLFYSYGYDLLNSIATTAGLVALMFPALSLLAWKTISFDFVVTKSRALIKKWLCRKYRHNPNSMAVLAAGIAENKRAMNELMTS
jgi:hypothetical protein